MQTKTYTHACTRVDPHGNASSFRSPVASDVFTLVWGDCYFCTEPDNSIIHCGCWCTHFTSLRKGAGVSFSACSMCACLCEHLSVHAYVRRPPTEDELLTCHTKQWERKEARGGREKELS